MRRYIALVAANPRLRLAVSCSAWIGLALVYGCLAFEASRFSHTTLPRAGFGFAPRQNVRNPNLHVQQIVNELAAKHDMTILTLERSLQSSARTRFAIDVTAACASLAGLFLQWSCARSAANPDAWPVPLTMAIKPLPWRFRRRAQPSQCAAEPHDGSFPDGGYGR
jgi:hypothetical protein